MANGSELILYSDGICITSRYTDVVDKCIQGYVLNERTFSFEYLPTFMELLVLRVRTLFLYETKMT